MSTPVLPPIASLPTANEETIKAALDALFEPSPEIHALAVPEIQRRGGRSIPDDDIPPFTSYASLIRHIGTLLHQLALSSSLSSSSSPSSLTARRKVHGILGSHPRLGAKRVDSAQSRAEQAQLNNSSNNNNGEAETEAERLADLNREYEARFPGLRYVVFVNGRGRKVIMEDMRRRIDRGDVEAEEREAIQAMIDIALDRAAKLGSTPS
ncbi:Oxo-4-hydroxy-4-carboxy-5-ureidoimidazoline decarboxylase [Nemania sp. NC0429]|nr:Oxo-4-hydroxy-4-carboxy-5-ureidoimidazoline decarboxylase [Nemania sp. NC0429]